MSGDDLEDLLDDIGGDDIQELLDDLEDGGLGDDLMADDHLMADDDLEDLLDDLGGDSPATLSGGTIG